MMGARSRLISTIFFWLSVIAFLSYAVAWGVKNGVAAKSFAAADLVLPLLVYCAAHALRALRLGVLLGAGRARRLLGLYLYTAACSASIPFKLGELVRINEIAVWTGIYWRGLLIVWIERVFDVLVIAVISIFILIAGVPEPREIGLLLWVIGGFVFMTTVFFFVLPEQLCDLNLHIIRSYKGIKAVRILLTLESFYMLFEQVKPILAGKVATLSLLSFLIWGAELFSISLLFDVAPWMDAAVHLVQQFTTVLGDGVMKGSTISSPVFRFEGIKMIVLIAAGLIALPYYWKSRFQLRTLDKK